MNDCSRLETINDNRGAYFQILLDKDIDLDKQEISKYPLEMNITFSQSADGDIITVKIVIDSFYHTIAEIPPDIRFLDIMVRMGVEHDRMTIIGERISLPFIEYAKLNGYGSVTNNAFIKHLIDTLAINHYSCEISHNDYARLLNGENYNIQRASIKKDSD